VKQKFFLFCQYLAPQHWLSRLFACATFCQWLWLKNFMIKFFIKRYRVDLSIAELEQVADYVSFNDFFTRALKATARPIVAASNVVISPVDGAVAQVGSLAGNILLQAKGKYFTTGALLANSQHDFDDGDFVTFYLSPQNYHRVHLPVAGVLKQTTYIPGKLFSVNTVAMTNIDQLLVRNERLVCYFETTAGPLAVIFVGAMLVGNIATVWRIAEQTDTIKQRYYHDLVFAKGAEIGRFNTGSSVILLFTPGRIVWESSLVVASAVQMGQAIGSLLV
jgi:phosphatidylserine decarboxylase